MGLLTFEREALRLEESLELLAVFARRVSVEVDEDGVGVQLAEHIHGLGIVRVHFQRLVQALLGLRLVFVAGVGQRGSQVLPSLGARGVLGTRSESLDRQLGLA
jgi:hypothetical protein